jgi:GAF domain-containing protein
MVIGKRSFIPGRPKAGRGARPGGVDKAADRPTDWAPAELSSSPMALDESALRRESELRRLSVLLARGDNAYQYVVETAARICQTPMALIALMDGDRQWVKASVGVDTAPMPLNQTICQYVITGGGATLVLPDATQDARTARLPLVAGPPGVRLYAGVPLTTSQGVPLGAVAVVDLVPRQLTPVQIRTLELLARQTMLLLESGTPAAPPG